jgi:predicted transcriptional regulator
VARKSVLDKIARGVGLEDPEVRKYVLDKYEKQKRRMQRYEKVRSLMGQLEDEEEDKVRKH